MGLLTHTEGGLELLAADWRSEAIVDQLERLDGLGPPADRLDALYSELAS